LPRPDSSFPLPPVKLKAANSPSYAQTIFRGRMKIPMMSKSKLVGRKDWSGFFGFI
jgi:hypothetical protein